MKTDKGRDTSSGLHEMNRIRFFRYKALNLVLLLAAAASLGYVPYLYTSGLYSEFFIVERNLVFSTSMIAFLIIFNRFPHTYDLLLKLGLLMVLLLFVHTLFVETNNGSRHMWFVILILAAYFLGNRAVGAAFTFISVAVLIFYDLQTFAESNLSTLTIIDAIVIMLLLSIIVSIFLREYYDLVIKLKEYQVQLKDDNRYLDAKARAEASENKMKTDIMIKESRFAQVGKTLSLIAHHWRQPLGAIASTSANMRMSVMLDKKDDESIVEGLEFIDTHVKELSEMINDFRDFFQTSQHKDLLQARDIVQSGYRIVQEALETQGIEFFFDFKESSKIKVYKNEMIQVIVNIMTNASEVFRQRKSRDAKIYVRTYEDHQDVVIELEDNAGGIGIEHLSDIFEPYFSTKEQRNGTGLGLYVSKTIVEHQTSGLLSVERTDQGLCFRIKIKKFAAEDL